MKYIENTVLPAVRGKTFALPGVFGTDRHTDAATLGEACWWLLDQYTPNPQLGMVLDNSGIRSRAKVMNILEGEPQEKGHYRFEDADFAVLQKVIGWIGPYISRPDYSPILEDLLGAAVTNLSEKEDGN